MCSPEIANMCASPAVLKSCAVSGLIKSLSPVIRAIAMGAVWRDIARSIFLAINVRNLLMSWERQKYHPGPSELFAVMVGAPIIKPVAPICLNHASRAKSYAPGAIGPAGGHSLASASISSPISGISFLDPRVTRMRAGNSASVRCSICVGRMCNLGRPVRVADTSTIEPLSRAKLISFSILGAERTEERSCAVPMPRIGIRRSSKSGIRNFFTPSLCVRFLPLMRAPPKKRIAASSQKKDGSLGSPKYPAIPAANNTGIQSAH